MADSKSIRQLGDIRVTAIPDGFIDAPVAVVENLDEAGKKALAELAAGADVVHPFLHVYLIETGGRKILVDAGAGGFMGPNAGKMPENLKAAGVSLEDVDTILISHCHPDHILGVVDVDWNAVFPNAVLRIPGADHAFFCETDLSTISNEFVRTDMTNARRCVAAYGDRVQLLTGADVAPGVSMEPLPGHTPGHSGYLVEGGGKKLCLWGDIVHLPQFQPARPDASLAFDIDPVQARKTRREMFERVIAEDLEIGGGHILAPGFARVERAGDAYRIVPADG